MSERRRQAYLNAMGIDSWMPRFPLPGAAPSLLLDDGIAAHDVQAVSEALSDAFSVDAGAPIERDNVAARDVSMPRPAISAQANKLPPATTAASAPTGTVAPGRKPQFRLAFVRSDSDLLIVDDWPLANTIAVSAYMRFIHELLFAVGRRTEQAQPELFIWPMIKNNQVDQGPEAARQTLSAYLQTQLQKFSARYLLLMGDAARQYLFQAESSLDDLRGRRHELDCLGPRQVVTTHGIAALLSQPCLKRDAWADLLLLRDA